MSIPAAAFPASGVFNDRGTFNISIAGKSIGTEKFEIHSSQDKIITRAEIQLRTKNGGKVLEQFHK